MAGMFELFIDAEASFRFQLTAPDGTVMAVSRPFPSKPPRLRELPLFASTQEWGT